MENILIIEDNEDVNLMLSKAIKNAGYNVKSSFTGIDGLNEIKTNSYDLVLLDIMLPYKSGDQILKEVRQFSSIPIIIISAKDMISTKIDLLKLGADDYITKPFSVVVLHKRIEALQRRIQGRQQNNKWIYKDVEVDFLGFCAKKDNNPVDLKPKEIKLLELLIKHKNQVLTRNQMLDSLWEIDEAPADRVIDVYIKNLRKKLDLDCITTVKGIGYKFEDK